MRARACGTDPNATKVPVSPRVASPSRTVTPLLARTPRLFGRGPEESPG